MNAFKYLFLILPLLVSMGSVAFSQNLPPVVEITNVELDPQTSTISVEYTLLDSENDPCSIHTLISEDGGLSFSPFPFTLSGDLGANISPGEGKIFTMYPVIIPDSLLRIKVIAYDDGLVDLADLVAQVDSNRLRSDLNFIAQERNHEVSLAQLDMIRDSIRTRMMESGLETMLQPVPYGGYTGANVKGTRRGLEMDSSIVIVDGHFDAVPNTPGANDNAVAIVALLEIARILSPGNYRRSLEFLAFDLEEYGLVGAKEYVQQFDNSNKSILGVLNLEMIGYFTDKPNTQEFPAGFSQLFPLVYQAAQADSFRGNFLANVANIASVPLQESFDSLAAIYASDMNIYSIALPGNGSIAPDFRRSDHAAFWDASVQALMLTGGGDLRDSAYHTGFDASSRISIDRVELVVKAVLATTAHLAGPLNSGEDVSGILSVSGIGDVLGRNVISLFPNPVSNELHLRSDQVIRVVRILDVQGRELLRQIPNEHTVDISCAGFPAGMYMVIAETSDGVWNASWIKE